MDLRPPASGSPLRAVVIGTVGILLVSLVHFPGGDSLNRAVPALLLLIPVVAAGVLGGRVAAAVVSLEASFAFATAFLPPIGSPRVDNEDDLVVLVLFVVVASATGIVTATIVSAERARADAERERNRSLQELDQQRSALLRSVSHDLRTPLATIRAVATDLHAGIPYDDATRDEMLDLVVDQAERLDRLVENLLSLSRIEAGAFLPDRVAVDLAELVEACTARLRRVLEPVTLVLTMGPDLPLVAADYSQIDQVLSNLLENAARHSSIGGEVEVAVEVLASDVGVTVLDHGSGLAPELRDRLFEPFVSSSSGGATGIGLAICLAIIEAHGGTLDARDTPGGGASFRFTLPRYLAPTPVIDAGAERGSR